MLAQGRLRGRLFTVRFSGHIVLYTVDVKTHLIKQKERMQYNKEVQAMKTYNLMRHLTTIITVFAAIFFLAGCNI